MIRTTLWSPDTCTCKVEYSWDDAAPEDVRTHEPTRVVKRCARHSLLAVKEDHFSQLADETSRKSRLLTKAQAQFPKMFDDETGEFLGSWAFDAGHALHITTVGLTRNQRNNVQAWADTNLGAGKIVIE